MSHSSDSIQNHTIFLFRSTNLRLQDQKSLKFALNLNQPIIFLNCLNLKNEWNRKWINQKAWSNRRRVFRLQSLYDIDKRLNSTNSKLFVTLADPVKALDLLFSKKKGVFRNLISNEEVGTYEIEEQAKIEKVCKKFGVLSHFVWDETMVNKDFYLHGTVDSRAGFCKMPVVKTQNLKVDVDAVSKPQNSKPQNSKPQNSKPSHQMTTHHNTGKISDNYKHPTHGKRSDGKKPGKKVEVKHSEGSFNPDDQNPLEKNSVLYERGKRRFHTNMPKVTNKVKDYKIVEPKPDPQREFDLVSKIMNMRMVSDPEQMKLIHKSPLHKPIFFTRNLDDAMKDFYQQSNLGMVQCLDIVTPYIDSFPFINPSSFINSLPDCQSIENTIQLLTHAGELKDFYKPDPFLEFMDGKTDQKITYENYSYPGGESAGFQRIFEHIWQTESLVTHKQTRNKSMGKHSSTKFSMWLANGNISGRQVLKEIAKFEREKIQNDGTQWVISEMLYRDYMRLGGVRCGFEMFTYGGMQRNPEKWNLFGAAEGPKRYDNGPNKKYPVTNRPSDWQAWCTGTTGYPYVDASMRELINTGWMNWRGRGNVASFLVYNLGVDWRWGAEFFEHHLLDHDVSLNYVNWQNMAGIGWNDRDELHNVVKQSINYEPRSHFIKFWIPELRSCPDDMIHTPWDWPGISNLKGGNIKRYCKPIRHGETFFYEKFDGSTTRDSKHDKSKNFESQRLDFQLDPSDLNVLRTEIKTVVGGEAVDNLREIQNRIDKKNEQRNFNKKKSGNEAERRRKNGKPNPAQNRARNTKTPGKLGKSAAIELDFDLNI